MIKLIFRCGEMPFFIVKSCACHRKTNMNLLLSILQVPQIPCVCLFTKNQWNWNRQPLTGRHINRLPSYWSYKPSYHENHDSASHPMKSQLLVGQITIFPKVFSKVFHQVPGRGHPAPAFVSRSSRWSTRPLPAVPCSSPPGAAWGGTAGVGCVGWDFLEFFSIHFLKIIIMG
jgi:hypothetical protein